MDVKDIYKNTTNEIINKQSDSAEIGTKRKGEFVHDNSSTNLGSSDDLNFGTVTDIDENMLQRTIINQNPKNVKYYFKSEQK